MLQLIMLLLGTANILSTDSLANGTLTINAGETGKKFPIARKF
ncbi:MAG: hypothetical protein CM15mP127_05930 [Gammaproteobacteria bacterium]|nr:MAG: hypothetical protein CM15mP127_05930 [Gammaproteobacteria bacterium]